MSGMPKGWLVDPSSVQDEVEIGRGRSGTVYRVRCGGAVMACKRLNGGGVDGQRQKLKTFLLKEAKALSRLHHPHIISLFGVCISEHSLALLMEYAGKGTLRDELDGAIQVLSNYSFTYSFDLPCMEY
jgi:serine/threonine protein kinase